MGKTQTPEPPRIFISHTWEEKDKALTHVLEKALREAGAKVWVDHAGIRGGDNLPKQINDALDWCNALVLVWSKAAKASHWVELEWTNAISLQKRIIPCPHDGTSPPPILANKAYVNFANEAEGLRQLLTALQLAPPSRETRDAIASLASVPHAPVIQTAPIPKSSPGKPGIVQLRATPINSLSMEAVQQMLEEKSFYDGDWNSSGKGINHQYENVERHSAELVIDHATGLTWQQSGSENYMTFEKAADYIRPLNAKNYGGYTNWRLPTLEEAMSLMEREKKNGNLYIDPVFDRTQTWIWTADYESAGRAWYVGFNDGHCGHFVIGNDHGVRAVRS